MGSLEGTPSIFPSPPLSYMEKIRSLTAELVSASAVGNVPPKTTIAIKTSEIEVVDSIAYRTIKDFKFLKVREFWADADIAIPISVVKQKTWFFISEGSSEVKQDGKIIGVEPRGVVYFEVGDTFGGFTFTGDLRGVVVTMAVMD